MDSAGAARQKVRWGAEITPILSDDVSQAIRMEAVRSGRLLHKNSVEVGGLLTASPASYSERRVDGFQVTSCEHLYGPSYRLSRLDRGLLRTQIARIQASGSTIVGYFRTSTREELTVSPEDIAVVQELLPDAQFILIAKRSPLSDTSSRLYRPGADRQWSKCDEFKLPKRTASRVTRLPGIQESLSISTIHPLRIAPKTKPPRWPGAVGRRFKIWYFAMGVVLLSLNIAYVAWDRSQTKTIPSAPDLGLAVDVQGSDLHVTWNRSLPAVRFAKSAKLKIDDNGQRQEVVLDARQVANGSVLYTPTSSDVSFHMDVEGRDAQSAAGGFRVLNVTKGLVVKEKEAAAIPEAPPETHPSVSRASMPLAHEAARSNVNRSRASKTWEPPIVETPRASVREQPEALEAPPALAADVPRFGAPPALAELPTPAVKSATPPRRVTAKVFRAVTKFFLPKDREN